MITESAKNTVLSPLCMSKAIAPKHTLSSTSRSDTYCESKIGIFKDFTLFSNAKSIDLPV